MNTPLLSKSVAGETPIVAASVGEARTMMQEENEITQEFYAMSILLSLVMGIVIGWIFLRK
jgi:hypothetical protein